MNKNEEILMRLDKLYRDLPTEYCGYVLTAIQDIEAIIYRPKPASSIHSCDIPGCAVCDPTYGL